MSLFLITYTHSLSSLSLSLSSLSQSLSLSLSSSITHTLSQPQKPHTHTLSLLHTQTHSAFARMFVNLNHFHCFPHFHLMEKTLIFDLSSNAYFHSISPSLSLLHPHSHTHTNSLSLSFSIIQRHKRIFTLFPLSFLVIESRKIDDDVIGIKFIIRKIHLDFRFQYT